MPSKEELGRRLRIARFERNMTLKEVAARAGMSATHISEVERGKTSPTIGALQKISKALGENPSHFVREDTLPRSSVTRADARCKFYAADIDGKPLSLEVMSGGVPGGNVQAFKRTAAPGELTVGFPMIGEVVLICEKGMVRVSDGGEESYVLRDGDTIQMRLDDGYTGENIGEEDLELIAILAAPTLFTI
jgi:transcriptional regulator with XRE-family HTH domain